MTPKNIKEIEIKETKLRKIIRECGSMVIAYSGGVDSTLVAKVAHQELGRKSLMVIADSPSLARQELEAALTLAQEQGFPVKVITTNEMDNPLYQVNTGNRCYHCKVTLYRYLEKIRNEIEFRYLVNGDQVDDQFIHRPGKKATEENAVRSVLAEAGLNKAEIRLLSKKLGLPNHDKPASPCLASRIPVGTKVTTDKLKQVEKAEHFLKTHYFIRNLRVRHYGNVARIETLVKYFPIIENHEEEIKDFLTDIGFMDWELKLLSQERLKPIKIDS